MAYFYSWHSKDLLCITSMKNGVLNNTHFSCKNWNTYTKITTNTKCFKDPLKQWVRGYQIQYIFSKIQQSKCLHQNFFPKKFYILLVPTTFLSPLKFRYLHCFLCLVTSLDLVLQVTYISFTLIWMISPFCQHWQENNPWHWATAITQYLYDIVLYLLLQFCTFTSHSLVLGSWGTLYW